MGIDNNVLNIKSRTYCGIVDLKQRLQTYLAFDKQH